MQAVGLGRVVLDTGRAAATTAGRVAGDSDLLSRRHFDFVPKLSFTAACRVLQSLSSISSFVFFLSGFSSFVNRPSPAPTGLATLVSSGN